MVQFGQTLLSHFRERHLPHRFVLMAKYMDSIAGAYASVKAKPLGLLLKVGTENLSGRFVCGFNRQYRKIAHSDRNGMARPLKALIMSHEIPPSVSRL